MKLPIFEVPQQEFGVGFPCDFELLAELGSLFAVDFDKGAFTSGVFGNLYEKKRISEIELGHFVVPSFFTLVSIS